MPLLERQRGHGSEDEYSDQTHCQPASKSNQDRLQAVSNRGCKGRSCRAHVRSVSLGFRSGRGPASVDGFFHYLGIAAACQVIGQGHRRRGRGRGREKSHLAVAGPELQRPDSGVANDDPATECVGMVLPIAHRRRKNTISDRCFGVLRSQNALRRYHERGRRTHEKPSATESHRLLLLFFFMQPSIMGGQTDCRFAKSQSGEPVSGALQLYRHVQNHRVVMTALVVPAC